MADREVEIRAELEAMAKLMVEQLGSNSRTLKLEDFKQGTDHYAAIYSWYSAKHSTVKVKFSIYIDDHGEKRMSVEPIVSPELALLLTELKK